MRFRESQMGHFRTVHKCLFTRLANLHYPDVVLTSLYVHRFAGITASSFGAIGLPPGRTNLRCEGRSAVAASVLCGTHAAHTTEVIAFAVLRIDRFRDVHKPVRDVLPHVRQLTIIVRSLMLWVELVS